MVGLLQSIPVNELNLDMGDLYERKGRMQIFSCLIVFYDYGRANYIVYCVLFLDLRADLVYLL